MRYDRPTEPGASSLILHPSYLRAVLLTLLLAMALPALARAGIYIPADFRRWATGEVPPWMFSGEDFREFQRKRMLLQNLGIKRTEAEQKNLEADETLKRIVSIYERDIARLEARQAAGTLTTEDRVNLSGYYLRLSAPNNPERLE